MQHHIKEWSDQTASLIAEDGHSPGVFESLGEAIDACCHDCLVEPEYIDTHSNCPGASPVDFESGFVEGLPK